MNAIIKTQTPELLAQLWHTHKMQEEYAKKKRYEVENALIEALGFDKPEGSKTFRLSEGWKVTCKASSSYKLDEKIWAEIAEEIPGYCRPVKVKIEVDQTGVKWLKDNDPAIWAKCAQAITVTPSKVGISVQKMEEK